MFFMLMGYRPYNAESVEEIFEMILTKEDLDYNSIIKFLIYTYIYKLIMYIYILLLLL